MNPEDHLVTLISRWLAGHIDDRALREGLDTTGLSGEHAEAVEELAAELDHAHGRPGHLQMAAREALEALAMA
jgi:hypothetical protein